MFTRQVSVKQLSGPIGIGQADPSGRRDARLDAAHRHHGHTSRINLGILNLLPIPILDGGMILFLLIETIMRRDVNQQIKERVYQVAFVCILASSPSWSSSTT